MGFSGKCICALCIKTLFKLFLSLFFCIIIFSIYHHFLSDIGLVQPAGNLNLLLAAAVAGVQTDDDDDDSSSDDEGDRECLTVDKAMELWMKHKTIQQNGKITHFII